MWPETSHLIASRDIYEEYHKFHDEILLSGSFIRVSKSVDDGTKREKDVDTEARYDIGPPPPEKKKLLLKSRRGQ